MTKDEAEPVIVELVRNLLANENFAAPRKTFEAMEAFVSEGEEPAVE